MMPASFMSNLNEALLKRTSSSSQDENVNPNVEENEEDGSKPRILVTNGDGIDSPGLTYLVAALVKEGLYNVFVCAPQLDKSTSGHGVTFGETIAVSSVDMIGATAYEVTGTTADCVSLALSGALFSWSKPALVVCGINKGACCGHTMLYSGVVSGAREALLGGVPSISVSLNWKRGESQECDLNNAVGISVPIINAAVRDIQKGVFPKKCALSIQFPLSPSSNKGFKVTKQSLWRPTLCWQATHLKKQPYLANQPGYGFQLAQLGRDASAAGAVRLKNNVEIESVGAARSTSLKKHFRLEFIDKKFDGMDEDSDIQALESNFIAVTPICISSSIEPDVETSAAEWIASTTKEDQ